MKRMQLQSLLFVFAAAITLTSCKPSRVWATKDKHDKHDKHDREERDERTVRNTPAPPPSTRYYSSASLVISPTPGFVMNRNADGRYYHRSPQGFLYWKGYDNRFFLDKSYLHRVNYSQREYEQWKRYNREDR